METDGVHDRALDGLPGVRPLARARLPTNGLAVPQAGAVGVCARGSGRGQHTDSIGAQSVETTTLAPAWGELRPEPWR